MRSGPVAVALAVSVATLLSAAGAQADPVNSEHRADQLRSANAALAVRSQNVLLELFALDSQLAGAERRVASLREQAAAVARKRESAREHLVVVRRTLAEAEERLALRLRDLYMEGDPDPLAILLGAASLDEAITALENLGQFAERDREIIVQVRHARADVRAALSKLAAREAELRALVASAEAARARLAAVRAQRAAYLAGLVRQKRLNQEQLARLSIQAEQIGTRADEIADEPSGGGPEAPGASTAPGGGGSAPPPAAGGGQQMTVSSTGYCLQGTTATGIPVSWGVIAVDPGVIPLGTRMYVPGYGEGVAADTGGAIRGAIIDLWFPSCSQAIQWGRRTVTITLR